MSRVSDQLVAVGVSVAVIAVIGGVGVFAWQGGRSKPTEGAACSTTGKEHSLELRDDAFSQPSITIDRCDVILIKDSDTRSYDLNFGEHNQHLQYPGYTARMLQPTETIKFTATQAGEYRLHDHFRDRAELHIVIK